VRLGHKVAIVAGGGRGTGRAAVIALAGAGANAVMDYVTNSKAADEVTARSDTRWYRREST